MSERHMAYMEENIYQAMAEITKEATRTTAQDEAPQKKNRDGKETGIVERAKKAKIRLLKMVQDELTKEESARWSKAAREQMLKMMHEQLLDEKSCDEADCHQKQ